jgi:metal-responsive CopG/Arc/MetJ family transcriptional regulator
MRTVTVKLPEDLDQMLELLAKRQGLTRSEVIRQALRAFTKERAQSVGDLAADLAGSIEGPTDLSTSSEHMTGHGE